MAHIKYFNKKKPSMIFFSTLTHNRTCEKNKIKNYVIKNLESNDMYYYYKKYFKKTPRWIYYVVFSWTLMWSLKYLKKIKSKWVFKNLNLLISCSLQNCSIMPLNCIGVLHCSLHVLSHLSLFLVFENIFY